jgi:mono/diheme cytochrome c family protein
VLLLLSLSVSGCARAPIPDYASSADVQKLPERHQEQIASALKQLFGTPTRPHLMAVGAEEEAESESADDESSDGDSADASDEATDSADADVDATEGAASATKKQAIEFEVPLVETVSASRLRSGADIYRTRCGGCHGVTGDGLGEAAAYLVPKPRDYRKGIFKFTSTPYGMKPTRADLVRTIRRGAKGTSMPAFPWMSEEDLQDVIDYVILLSQRGEVEVNAAMIAESDYTEDEDMYPEDFLDSLVSIQEAWREAEETGITPVSPEPAYNDESIAAGREAFMSRGCSKCHGEDGKGQMEWISSEFLAEQTALPEDKRIQINFDAWGEPAPAADLTARMLHGGRRPLDIYRRIYTGINGTPMPAFGDALAEEPDTIWHLVHYVLSIVEGREAAREDTPSSET